MKLFQGQSVLHESSHTGKASWPKDDLLCSEVTPPVWFVASVGDANLN